MNFFSVHVKFTTRKKKLKRQHQYKFRRELIKKYKKCIITKETEHDALRACHIKPFADSSVQEMYDINNGLLMTSTMHDFYDNYHFTILLDGKIVVSKKSKSIELKKYDGKCIDITINNEMKKYLKIHNSEFYEKQSN